MSTFKIASSIQTTANMHLLAVDIRAKAAANTDNFAALVSAGNWEAVAAWYNQPSTQWVWKSFESIDDIYSIPGFNWTLIDGLTQGKRDEWNMLMSRGGFSPFRANQRAAIMDIWVGTAPKVTVQTAIMAECKRLANNAEALALTTTEADTGANGTQALPMNLTFESTLYGYIVDDAMRNYS